MLPHDDHHHPPLVTIITRLHVIRVSSSCCVTILRVSQFEANERLRSQTGDEDDSDDDEDTKAARRLEAGAYTQQRLAVVMVVTAAHSSAVARRVDGKLLQVGDWWFVSKPVFHGILRS